MTFKKHLIAAASVLLLSACGQAAMDSQQSANGAKAELVATIKGCEVWRTYDHSYVYVTICDGKFAADTQSEIGCGKGCRRNQYSKGVN